MTPSTKPASTVGDVIERVRALQEMLRANAADGETHRRVPDDSFKALQEAGVFRVGTPKRFGGFEGTVQDMLDVSAAVAYADGGAGWVTTLANVGGWLTSLFPRRTQDEIFGADSDAIITGIISAPFQVTRVEGGYRLTGRAPYNSGSWWSTWGGVGVPLPNESGDIVGQGLALFPSSEFTIEDTWHTAGMRSSASNTMVLEDVFVPDHRILSIPEALEGAYPNEFLDEEPTHRAAFVPVLALVLIGPQLGLGRAALDYVVERTQHKGIAYSFFERQSDSTAVQLQVAKAAMLLDTAELHARRAASTIDDAAAAGKQLNLITRARVRADTAWIAEAVLKAIDILLHVHGAGSFAEVNPLQRIWRDANTGGRHGVVSPAVSYEVYGKALVGNETPVSPLV